jgi:two-component system chemotaxis response regulator CheB
MRPPTLKIVRGASAASGKIRVLAVDDSVVIRHLLREALQQDPDIEFVGAAANGVAALARIPVLKPDVVTLDIEMPEMDGLETLRHIRKLYPRLRTIMFSTLTSTGAGATFEALSAGADDYVTKASNAGSLDRSLSSLRAELIPKVKQFFALPGAAPAAAGTPQIKPPAQARASQISRPQVVAIGISTGGPQALSNLLPKLPSKFPLPILIVQHMPPMFTRLLADRLRSAGPLHVEEAADGTVITPGRVYIAPGDYHLRVRRAGSSIAAVLDHGPQENSCRPAADVLFRSVAESYGGDVLCVVMTGMGSDGLRGAQKLKAAGAQVLVQDEASSVVWGMPGAVAEAGIADQIVPLDQLAGEIARRAMR